MILQHRLLNLLQARFSVIGSLGVDFLVLDKSPSLQQQLEK